jgi:antitoxin VapB
MALHIRDDRAAQLARELADRKGVTMTQAVVEALEGALAREGRPLVERLQQIADEAARLSDPARKRKLGEQEIDDLWGNP